MFTYKGRVYMAQLHISEHRANCSALSCSLPARSQVWIHRRSLGSARCKMWQRSLSAAQSHVLLPLCILSWKLEHKRGNKPRRSLFFRSVPYFCLGPAAFPAGAAELHRAHHHLLLCCTLCLSLPKQPLVSHPSDTAPLQYIRAALW